MFELSRRGFLLTSAATVATASITAPAFAADPILIGVPTDQSGPVGVADQQDWLNGVTMAVEEINAAGGVNGRMLETRVVDIDLLTPEGTVAAYQSLVEQGVHALAQSFAIIPQPTMDVVAVTGTLYLNGNTSQATLDLIKSDPQKYRNIFRIDVAETWYGAGLVRYLQDAKAGGWTPKNNRVQIVQEQIGYTPVISKATQDAIAATNGEWEVGAITDIQVPMQDWSPVIQALKEQDAGVIMIDHWVAAELASFATTYVLDPVPGAPVCLKYGPSLPEFLDLAGDAAEGFIWGSVIGTYNDEKGAAFRAAYQAKFPGTMGMVHTGSGYDTVQILASVWATVDPSDFDAVGKAIKAIRHRGVCRLYTFDNEANSATSCPNMTDDPEGGEAQLIFQVQDGQHKIISPAPFAESTLQPVPWM